MQPNARKNYPSEINSKPKQALFDNLGGDEKLAVLMDAKIKYEKDDDWRSTHIKRKKVEIAIRQTLQEHGILDESEVARIYDIVTNQQEY